MRLACETRTCHSMTTQTMNMTHATRTVLGRWRSSEVMRSFAISTAATCYIIFVMNLLQYTYTHPFNGPFSGIPGWAGTKKVKPIWILLKQETVSGSGISWAMYKSAPRSRQITMPAPHHSVFLQAGCPSCRTTNSVKALKAQNLVK